MNFSEALDLIKKGEDPVGMAKECLYLQLSRN